MSRPGHFTLGKDLVPIVYEAGWAPGPVWTGVENLAPTEFQYPDRLAHSDSYTDYAIPVRHCHKGHSEICKSQPFTTELVHMYRLTRNLEYTINHTPVSQPMNVKEVL
jgi:hypothetical protein